MNDAPFPSGAPASAGPAAPPPPANFFDWIRSIGITRSDDRWLAGVAGGIAAHTRLDPLIIRGIILVIALLGGPILFFYAVAWALLPDSSGRIHTERALKGIFDPAAVAIIVLIGLTFLPFMRGLWWQGTPDFWNMPEWLESTFRTGWILALLAGLVWLTVVIAKRVTEGAPAAPAQTPRSHEDFWMNAAAPTVPPTADATGAASDATSGAGSTDAPPSADPGTGTGDAFAATSGSATPSGVWYESPEAAHGAAGASPTVIGAVWDPSRNAAEKEAQRRIRDAERARLRREHEERYRRRQPGAAFVSISLGLSLLAGVFLTIGLGYTEFSDTALLIGVGGALAVIALATILSGIRGKESGALGFFAIVAILVLLFVGVFPRGTSIAAVGDRVWEVTDAAPGTSTGFTMGAGSPTLDLTGLDDRGAETGGLVELWLGAGTVDLELPDDVPVILEVSGGVAGVSYTDDGGDLRERGAPLYREVVRFGNTSDSDTTTVRIWLGAGSVDISDTRRSSR